MTIRRPGGQGRRNMDAVSPHPSAFDREKSMSPSKLPVGSFTRIEKQQLQAVIDRLQQIGYRTIGPQLADEAVVYDDLDTVDQLPIGWLDEQDGGTYRLRQEGGAWFDYVVGPHSLKSFLFPPRDTLLSLERTDEGWEISPPDPPARPVAAIGLRGCDLHALRIQDRVFLGDQYVDPAYQSRRELLFVAAVNCRRAAATCFCHCMGTGPVVDGEFDLALTELDDDFVVQIGSDRGGEVMCATDWTPATAAEIAAAKAAPEELKKRMDSRAADEPSPPAPSGPRGRRLDTANIRELLLSNLEHPRWQQTADRCLACANCTMVCPTCFCSSVEEVSDLSGEHVRRERSWASCFTAEHSYMHSGTVRKSIAAQYRQWLTHKLATWIDQFGTSGCVGCGRCITWCPVGIDLTEEVAAIRDTD